MAQRAYNNGMTASGFGTGGKYQQAIQAATAAVQGLAGGNLSVPWQVVQRRILLK
ncbi:adhesin [Escherichia coli]|nr:adhesin [Escherichia coli]EGF5319985.1 adhesin [Escherichia coli]EGP6190579.1 adhesin [Escherichia coli]EHH8142768.1 adhesin [Escherichia coli]EHP0887709.1 adhesin [Escherichia coli]